MNKLYLPRLDPETVHVMVDIETTSTLSNAGIWQIGACTFAEIYPKEFIHTIHPHTIDQSEYDWDTETINWQVKSNTVNWSEAFSLSTDCSDMFDMLALFKEWIHECRSHQRKLAIWSKGSYFDIPILEHAFRTEEINLPWSYREIYDCRTIFNLVGHKMPKFDGAHNGLQDAINQASELERVFRELF